MINCLKGCLIRSNFLNLRKFKSVLRKNYNTGIYLSDNNLSTKGKLIELKTLKPGIVTWYSCGPTVYDSAHIGHASSFIRLDAIRRILESKNIKVLKVMGITDIDDKIINKSNVKNIPWLTLTKHYELEFKNDLKRLNVKPPQIWARVSDYVPNIITFISDLLKKSQKIAYVTSDGSVYFNTGAYTNSILFKVLDEKSTEEPYEGSEKKSPYDFALWKGHKPGEPFWETPWGKGRPGWHIECSVMASHFFGPNLDVHSGGKDLSFPHHANEESQCCAKYDLKQWVSHWIHTGHLIANDDIKMSKSIGNTVKIDTFLNEYTPDVLRMLSLMRKYNTDIQFSEASVSHADALVNKIKTFLNDADAILNGNKTIRLKSNSEQKLWTKLQEVNDKINSHLINNFDTPSAILLVIELISDFNSNIKFDSSEVTSIGLDYELLLAYKISLQSVMETLGFANQLTVEVKEAETLLDPILTEYVSFRNSVRNFSLAMTETDNQVKKSKIMDRKTMIEACDYTRSKMDALGIEIKDHGNKSSWAFKKDKKLVLSS